MTAPEVFHSVPLRTAVTATDFSATAGVSANVRTLLSVSERLVIPFQIADMPDGTVTVLFVSFSVSNPLPDAILTPDALR